MSKLLFATLFSLLLFVGLHVTVDAVGMSAEKKTQRETADCLVKEPGSHEHSDSSSEENFCSPFKPRPTSTTAEPTTTAAVTSTDAASTTANSTDASSSSSAGSTPAPHSHFHSRCRLKHKMVNASLTCMSGLDKAKFDVLIHECEDEVFANRCGCLSGDDKAVKCGKKLKKFFSKNKSIKKKCHYKKIGNWGHWRDLTHVTISIQNEKTVELLLLDGNDECKFFEGLRNGTKHNATLSVEIEILIVKIRGALKTPGWSKTQKKAKIHKIMRKFFKDRPTCGCEDLINSIEIEGFGSVETFRDVFKVSHQTSRLKKVISGSNEDDCELIKKLNITGTNESIETSKRIQILQLKEKFKTKFQAELSLTIRLQYVSQEIWKCLQLSPWVVEELMDIELKDDDDEETCGCDDGKWGDVYELSFCSNMCTNDSPPSCDEAEGGEGEEPTAPTTAGTTSSGQTSSSAAPSTSTAQATTSGGQTSSSAAPSTSTAQATTTVSNCDKRKDVIVDKGNSFGNASWFEYSIQLVYNNWLLPHKTAFNSDYNRMKKIINDTNMAYTAQQRILDLVNVSRNHNPTYRPKLMAITIQGGIFSGTIETFCECSPPF